MFTKASLAALAQLEPRQVTFLIDKGIIKSAGGGGKRGANFSFDRRAAVDACVAAELVRFGQTYKVINNFLDKFRKDYNYGEHMVSSETGAKVGGKWLILCLSDKGFEALVRLAPVPLLERHMKDGRSRIVIDMARIEDRVEAADLE
jgi:hypothetical protein